jgi:hypothetical protein
MTEAEFEFNQRLLAQTASLKAVLMALIDSHPDKAAFSLRLSEHAEHLTTHFLNTQLSDLFDAEFQTQMAEFQSRAQSS